MLLWNLTFCFFFCSAEQCKAPPQGRKHSVSKSLRHLFQPTSKFVKSLKRWILFLYALLYAFYLHYVCFYLTFKCISTVCSVTCKCFPSLSRGLYLTSIFYRDDNVLVTPEDQIPIVEVEDSYSSSLMQDFLWFTKVLRKETDPTSNFTITRIHIKHVRCEGACNTCVISVAVDQVSYLWEEIPWLQQCLSLSQTSCSCTLQTRIKMLQAVSHLQVERHPLIIKVKKD